MSIAGNWRKQGIMTRFIAEKCGECGQIICPPRDDCPECGNQILGEGENLVKILHEGRSPKVQGGEIIQYRPSLGKER